MDNNDIINVGSLHPKQLEVWNSKGRFNILKTGRRFGKTVFLENRCILLLSSFDHYSDYKEYYVGWFTPHIKYLMNSFKRIKKALKPLIIRSDMSKLTIELSNGGVIKFYHLEGGDAGNGEKFHYVFIDEAGLSSNLLYQWRENIRPTLMDYRGKAFISGTPKGKNDYYQLFVEAQENNNWVIHTGTSYDNPFVPNDEVDEYRSAMPPHIFDQEIMAKFIDDIGSTFIVNRRDLERCFVDNPREFYVKGDKTIGFDIASDGGYDTNAVCILDSNVVADLVEFNTLDPALLYLREKVANNQYELIYDAGGIGGNMHRELEEFTAFLTPFFFGRPPFGKDRIYMGNIQSGQLFGTVAMQTWWYLQLRIQATCRFLDGDKHVDVGQCIFFDNKASNKQKIIEELTQAVYLTNDRSGSIMNVDKAPNNEPSPNLADALILALSYHIRYGLVYF